mmetsp:Transcript_9866/g.11248  ORF Transcript_9866/g.11248 Transcript_9866/m.11248 type:complete len:293 (-) Transcript_9866:29-907(-)
MVNCACMFSAFCFVIANALGIAVVVEDSLSPSFDGRMEQKLDVGYIRNRWDHRRSVAPLQQTAHFFNMCGWLFMLIPLLQLSWALSRGGKRKVGIHTAIAAFAVFGCISEVLARLLSFGIWGAAKWIAESFNLSVWMDGSNNNFDGIGWKSLEINFFIMDGLLDWVDAFEWICLFNILILIYFSVGTQMVEHRVLSMWWTRLGLVIAFLSFVDFSADLLRLEEWRSFANFAIFVAIINTCFFLPVWLLWLSCTIRHVMPSSSGAVDAAWTPGQEREQTQGRAVFSVYQDSHS